VCGRWRRVWYREGGTVVDVRTGAISKRALKIAALKEKLRELEERQSKVEARRRVLAARRARKADARRLIVVGTVVLDQVARGEFDRAELQRWLDAALTVEADRRLFDLP